MDPYLEHHVLWESLHARLIVAIANQLQPKLDPRYITSIEERVFIEGTQRRIPDVWIQKVGDTDGLPALTEGESDTAVIIEIENVEINETRVEILDFLLRQPMADAKPLRALSAFAPRTAAAPEDPARRRRPRRYAGSTSRFRASLYRRPLRTPNPLRSAL